MKRVLLLLCFAVIFAMVSGAEAQGNTKTLSVRAENDYNQPGYSTQLAVYTDGVYRGTLYYGNNDNSWTVESIQIPDDAYSVRLEFAFDWCGSCSSSGYSEDGGDLNAYIDWLEVDGIRIEAENFDRTGLWDIAHDNGEWAYPYGVDSIEYSPYAEGNIITMAHGQDWVEFVVPSILPVAIDIKPGSDQNPINIDSTGVIPVAILTTDEFDAADANPETIVFGPDGAIPVQSALGDVDEDGDIDLILHFRTQDTGIGVGDTEATLTGETYDGHAIEGTDSARVLESRGKKK